MKIVLATGNAGKVAEMNEILADLGWQVVAQTELGVAAAEETGATFAENALIKARNAALQTGLPALADDSGLEVDALGREPGVHSARYAGEGASDAENNAKLLASLEAKGGPRTARFRCVLAFVRDRDDPAPRLAEGIWSGTIAHAARGFGGFGYDPVFEPANDPLRRTAAEMDAATKNRVSHRAQALRALKAALGAVAAGAP